MKKNPDTDELIVIPGEPGPEPVEQKIEAMRYREIFRLFHIRNYRLIYIGFAVSLLGGWIQNVAQGWLVYSMTQSPFWLGAVGFATSIPMFLIAPFGGTIADRRDRRRLLQVSQALLCLQSAMLAILTLTGNITVGLILFLAVFMGLVNAFDMPARQSLLLEVVGPSNIRSAIAMNSLAMHVSRILGPPLGGLLIAAVGEGWCFAINTFCFAAMMTGLLLLQVTPRVIRKSEHALRELKNGFLYAWHDPNIREAIIATAVAGGLGGTYLTMMPAIARSLLDLDSSQMGVLMSTIGVGAIIGGVAITRVHGNLMKVNLMSCGALGLSLMAFAQSRSLPLSMFLLIPTSFALVLGGGCAQTIIQTAVSEHMRGRMIAIYSATFMGAMTWGALVIGGLGSLMGIGGALTLGGAACFVTAGFMYVRRFGWKWGAA